MPTTSSRSHAAQLVIVLVTCPKRQVAEAIGGALVEEQLAACVNVIPGLTSIYRWEGKLCRDREVLLLVKTRRARLAALARRIRSLHPYTVPEIIALPVSGGSSAYLSWVKDTTS